ncbi:BQ2448_955 [Microbotryum intermedium]|uniref:BQ2448_955 protein n=1 Tax=Microbotryum intermedium TaxID=269621 RepID=A0A238FAC8_9BASI|nr:BQ2448_955 [Microbotryum intermedium]
MMLVGKPLAVLAAVAAILPTAFAQGTQVPYRYIVEYAQTGTEGDALHARDHLSKLKARSGLEKLTVVQEYYTPGVLIGHSVYVRGMTRKQLERMPAVKAVHPVFYYTLAEVQQQKGGRPSYSQVHHDHRKVKARGPAAAHFELRGQQVMDEQNLANTKGGFSPHRMTSIDILHQRGFFGQGVKSCFVEGHTQYTHPLLGKRGCFGSRDCAIQFGADLVGTNPDQPQPGPDPLADCDVRSTHILGQMVAPDNQFDFVGAIPQAEIGWYSIFPCGGGGATGDIIIGAFLKAANDGCQVISNSLISSVGWNDNDLGPITLNKLAKEKGVFAVSAWGVSRDQGLFYSPGPATGSEGVGAAYVDLDQYPFAYALTFESGEATLPYISVYPIPYDDTFEVYFLSTSPTDRAATGCDELPHDTPDLSNRAVVVQRAGCGFETQMANVRKFGARVLLVVNYPASVGWPAPYFDGIAPSVPFPVGMIQSDGSKNSFSPKQLLEYYRKNPKGLKLNFKDRTLIHPLNADTGGKISFYSSYGPDNSLTTGPTFGVPANQIAGLRPNGSVGTIDATSSPIANAIATLVLGARKDDNLKPDELRALLATTAKPISIHPRAEGEPLETTVLAGSGLVNALRAVEAQTLVTPFSFKINDTAHVQKEQHLTLKNMGKTSITYTFDSTAAQTKMTYDRGAKTDINPSSLPSELKEAEAKVSFEKTSITIEAGQTATVKVTITPPQLTAREKDYLPVYSGFINVHSSNKQDFYVSYFGLAADIVDMPIIDTSTAFASAFRSGLPQGLTYPYLLDNAPNSVKVPTKLTTFDRSVGVGVFVRFAQATRHITVDVIAGDSTIQGTIPSNGDRNQRRGLNTDQHLVARRLAPRADSQQLYTDVQVIGRIYEKKNQARDDKGSPDALVVFKGSVHKDLSMDGDASDLEDGVTYRVLVRALMTTADRSLEASWESWVSAPVQFKS